MKGKMGQVLLLVMLMIALFSGCAALLDREYLSVEPHLEQREESSSGDYLSAGTYTELKEAILRLVRKAQEEGAIRVYYSYPGSLDRDVPQAIYEVMQEEPLGAYAVEYIPYEAPVRFLNYSEVRLSISYRVSPEEIQAVQQAAGPSDLNELLGDTMRNLEKTLVVECAYYNESSYDLDKLIERQILADPERLLCQPVYAVTMYPQQGHARILEIQLDYQQSTAEIRRWQRELRQAAEEQAEDFQDLEGVDLIQAVTRWMTAQVQPDQQKELENSGGQGQKDTAFFAYGPLCQGSGTSQGVALAAKLLCNQAGLETLVVSGTREERPYYWNMVKLEDGWYHWDLYQILQGGETLLQGDDTMGERCTWTAGSVPSSGAEAPVLLSQE